MKVKELPFNDSVSAEFAFMSFSYTWQTAPRLYATREEWLTGMADLLRELFTRAGYSAPAKYKISCGFCQNKKAIGECWSASCSTGSFTEIFISPAIDNPVEVSAILVHELCHLVVGNQNKHNKVFGKCARSVGLTGKMTATTPTYGLIVKLSNLCDILGYYPHAKLLNPFGLKKQSTRLLKAECPYCGYAIRITRKWIDEAGLPLCPSDGNRLEEIV